VPDVVVFEFDPYLRLDAIAVRWEALGIAGAVLAALVAMAIVAGQTPAGEPRDRAAGHLRRDDLLFIALGAVPGAIVGGRLGYVLLHLEYHLERPGAILDPAQGGLQLGLAVAGGALTGAYVAALLDAPAGRWFHAAALPLLIGIEGGKAAMAWGGSGQGVPSAGPLATAYLGAGPWGSLAPSVPSVPSQLVEAGGAGLVAVVLLITLAAGGFGRLDGRAFVVAMGGWLVVRIAVATTWRDPAVVGSLNADQLISIALLIGLAPVALALARRGRGPGGPGAWSGGDRPDLVTWPEEATATTWRDA
jgi:phosphatidylglycerol:prolipoprotein diacylglycerol transferase